MKRVEIAIPWHDGLHARQAGLLVRTACKFGSKIQVGYMGQVADARSFIGLLQLSATMGSTVLIQVEGEDEEGAIMEIIRVFSAGD